MCGVSFGRVGEGSGRQMARVSKPAAAKAATTSSPTSKLSCMMHGPITALSSEGFVPKAADSRVVIDEDGAESLTGHGDGLIKSPEYNDSVVRFQGFFYNK